MLQVPEPVRHQLCRTPHVGRRADAIQLLTIDGGGYPNVCLLSLAHVHATSRSVLAVVGSPGTQQYLQDRGQAAVVVVVDGQAHYCKLSLRRSVRRHPATGYAFDLVHHKVDAIPGAELTGPGYQVLAEMPTVERWALAADLLSELLAGDGAVAGA